MIKLAVASGVASFVCFEALLVVYTSPLWALIAATVVFAVVGFGLYGSNPPGKDD